MACHAHPGQTSNSIGVKRTALFCSTRFAVSKPAPKPETADVSIEQLAREMIEASRMIEAHASRAAEQLEAQFFAYAKTLRKRAESYLPKPAGADAQDDD